MWSSFGVIVAGAVQGMVILFFSVRRDDHYLAHQRRDHPGEPVLSRREFECRRLDRLEVRPGQRCC
jgi:uncharacterized short protein YbdD (DUF466 family)